MGIMIPLSKPDLGEHEYLLVNEVLRSGVLSLGPRVKEFEDRFAAFVGSRHAVAVNSGTSALHLCVRALGIGADEEVITTSFSFVASANCLLYERAVPVFLDIDPKTLNLSPLQIERFLTERCARNSRGQTVNRKTGRVVKAILPVHVFGVPCAMDSIKDLARGYQLSVIEDSCEALGAKYRGRNVGTFGDAACFAFYPNKQMTTGEGGMIVTDNEEIARSCRSMRNQGRDEDNTWLRHVQLGYNYRLSDLHCALGLAQLGRLESLLQKRAAIAAAYDKALSNIPGLNLPSGNNKRSWFVYVVHVNKTVSGTSRDVLMQNLRAHGIGCQAYFPAIHSQPYMRGLGLIPFDTLPETEGAAARCLALPFFSTMTESEVEHVASTVRSVIGVGTPGITANHPVLAGQP